MKSVCIVGAGPAGLAAAKTFLQTEAFEVAVFEKKSRIGGIWALDQSGRDGFLSPHTPTNLSRFTVGFSDLDWNSVDLHEDLTNGARNGNSASKTVPMFPKAWMTRKYLEAYCQKYIPEGIVKCNHEVLNVQRHGERWQVTIRNESGQDRSLDFDYLIMASGFFSQPRPLEQNVSVPPEPSAQLLVTAVHTSAFRSLEDLFPDGQQINGKTILMIGGGNSSGEAAAAAALQLSDAQWSPDTSRAQRFKDIKIVHVTSRPLYPIPPFVEYDDGSRSYVPLDFKLYDFSKRPKDLPTYGGRQPMEVRNIVHRALQTMVGGDLSDISQALVSQKGEGRGSVYVALSESYAEYVRSGAIEVIAGRVTELENGSDGSVVAAVKQDEREFKIDDVAAIIYATGYTPLPALKSLDDVTKAETKYDPESMRLPVILEQWQTMSKDAPAVSFLGFYEGPYWPVIEMQARLTAERWLSGKDVPVKPYESQEELLKLRQSMHDRGLDIPQYWMGDHLGYMEDLAKHLDLRRNNRGFGDWEGIPSPARYLSPSSNVDEANSIMQELQQTWNACIIDGKYVARAAFRALQGNWTIERRIESVTPAFPSGIFTGVASFYPRNPTSDKSGKLFDFEYLYVESGTFTNSNGLAMTAKKRYVFRYSESDDTLSVWFVKPDNDLEVDYLFHDLAFAKPEQGRKALALIAKADHPCNKDMYWTEYRLPLEGIALRSFQIKHTVKGPKKDYEAAAKYERIRA